MRCKNELPTIPSEYIEPYLKRFLTLQMESVYLGFITAEEAKVSLKNIETFVNRFCGVHSVIATGNIYGAFTRLSDDDLNALCKKVLDSEIQRPA